MPNQLNGHKGTLLLLAPNAADALASSQNCYFVFQYNPEKLLHTFNQNSVNPQMPTGEFFS